MHFPPPEVFTREWGQVLAPAHGVWQRIGPGQPLWASSGNLERSAETRCSDCARTHPGYA
ncbi:hypothetical protein HerbRD11066_54510 [Herbidospora sp. RD11066]